PVEIDVHFTYKCKVIPGKRRQPEDLGGDANRIHGSSKGDRPGQRDTAGTPGIAEQADMEFAFAPARDMGCNPVDNVREREKFGDVGLRISLNDLTAPFFINGC